MENKACNGDEENCIDQVGAAKLNQFKSESANQKSFSCGYNNQIQSMKSSERSSPESESRSSSSTKRKPIESTKMEMDEVMEENQRLKMHLDRILKDYRTLQVKYKDMTEQEEAKKPEQETEELIALSLGRTCSGDKAKDDTHKIPTNSNEEEEEGLTLGLDFKFETLKKNKSPPNTSPENSVVDVKDDLASHTWPEKTAENGTDGRDDEVLQQNPNKRARVSVRVRCDTPTMNDGCQWRKYGQKIAKGNPCPRAYYRCTMASSCPVRKQVQRSAEDMSILITTYEGTHNHPLPIPATAMASTTSAAASMLISGSSSSGTGSTTATTASINGLNFYLSDSSRSKPLYLPNSSISTSPTCPTITLDLTSTTPSSSYSHLTRMWNSYPPRDASTNLNFSSLESNSIPVSWTNGMLSHIASHQPINKNQTVETNSLNFINQTQGALYQSMFNKTIQSPRLQQSLFPDTIAAATKAITSDPNFQSALAAALTSIISSGGGGGQISSDKPNMVNGVKANESFSILSSFPSPASTLTTNKCAPGFMNRPPPPPQSGEPQPNKVIILPPPFPFANSKSKSNSPQESRDHTV